MAKDFVEVLASAARTASPTDVTISVSPRAAAVLILIDVTAVNLTPSITVTVKGIVPGSGTEYDILASAAITGVGVTQLEIGAGLADEANLSESAILPQSLVVSVAHADADSITYSVGALFL